MATNPKIDTQITSLAQMVAVTCFCKLRERCDDKDSTKCMRNRNIVGEFMAAKHNKPIKRA